MKLKFDSKKQSARHSVSQFIITMPKAFVLFVFFILICLPGFSQGVAINASGAAPNSKAMLNVESNNSGLLVPRMTTIERDAITGTILEFVLVKNANCQCFKA